jgi:hypothetical protein
MAALSQPTSDYQFTGSTLQTQKKVLFCKFRKGKKHCLRNPNGSVKEEEGSSADFVFFLSFVPMFLACKNMP